MRTFTQGYDREYNTLPITSGSRETITPSRRIIDHSFLESKEESIYSEIKPTNRKRQVVNRGAL